MSDGPISGDPPAASLTGSELIPIVQSGSNKTTTPNQIVALSIVGQLGGDVEAQGFTSSGAINVQITNSGVTPGSYTNTNLTVGADGRITAADNGAGGSGSYVFLQEQVASSSSELLFTGWYSTSYQTYVLEFVKIVPSTNLSICIQMSTNGGSSYDSGGSAYATSLFESASTGSGTSGNSSTTEIIVMRNLASPGGNSQTSSGSYRLSHPGNTTHYKNVFGVGIVNTSGQAETQTHAGYYKSTSAVDAFRVFASTGNITSGAVRLYGIKHS